MTRAAAGTHLKAYERKRDFRSTPEPRARLSRPTDERGAPAEAAKPLTFVIQKHAATRLHYDFRLELDGVLKSWAVPKGPSLDPAARRLAVMVEDHPFEYAGFEGVIPKGEYGGGEVIVWDRGTYVPIDEDRPVEDRRAQETALRHGLEAGKITVELRGVKLTGLWHLARIDPEKNEWVLIKKRDESASATADILDLERSVISGRTIEEVRMGRSGAVIASELDLDRSLPNGILSPMLATLAREPFSAQGWLFEPKLDGMRALAVITDGRARLYSRRGNEITRLFPSLVEALARPIGDPGVLLDGEIVSLDARGAPSFERLQKRLHLASPEDIRRAEGEAPVIFYVFDLLWAGGTDLRTLQLSDRKRFLDIHLRQSAVVRSVAGFETTGEEAFRAAVNIGYEGVVAKRLDSRYESGARSQSWLKIKAGQSEDFVIGGYTVGIGRRANTFGALLVGQFDAPGSLRYVGRVGTGFDEKMLSELLDRLHSRQADLPPFANPPRLPTPVVWTRPELVAEVRFMQRTRDGALRAPVFVRLRDDTPPAEARPAQVVEPPGAPERREARPRSLTPSPAGRGAGGEQMLLPELRALGKTGHLQVEGHEIALSNLDKVLWPATKTHAPVTKRDLLAYLLTVSPYLLPHLRDRPLTLTRYPDGVTGKSFYQRHWEKSPPPYLQKVRVYSEHGRKDVDYLLCNNLATLVWLGQIADIELHTWFSRVDPMPDATHLPASFAGSRANVERSLLNYPDFIAFDLDPYTYSGREEPGSEPELNKKAFAQVCRVAKRLKVMLDNLGLEPFLKTSGKTGLHIYVPILRHYSYDATRAACETIGRYLMAAHPDDISMTWATGQRTGKVFFDHNMNARSKSVASIYSPRAVVGAGVSTPLKWEELESVWPLDLNVFTVPGRLHRYGDLWREILDRKHDLSALAPSIRELPPA